MFQDSNSLPISGGIILTLALYAGSSYFLTGEVIGKRTIDHSGWPAQCERVITQQIEADQPVETQVPEFNCVRMMGPLAPQLCPLIDSYTDPITDQIKQQKLALRHKREQQKALKAAKAKSRCDCATAITLEENRRAWAIYAGTWRLMEPSAVTNMQAELVQALNSPHCTMETRS